MAKRTFQQINFVTGVVDGTLAYDFDAPGYYREEEEAAPRPRRRRAPRTREREWVREEPSAEQAAGVGTAAVRMDAAMRGVSVIGAVAAVALLVLVLLAKIQLIGISAQALEYETQIETLEYQNSLLSVEYEQVFNLKDVKEAAVSELGMQEPREDQIYYLTGVSSADKAVVIRREDAGMFSLGTEDIMESVRAYLDNLAR